MDLVADHLDAAPGGLSPAARAADVQRLAGDHAGHRVPLVHRVGVHHPGHGLLVGVHVGRGNILFRPDEVDDLRCVASGHALQLAPAHILWVADDPALGATEGDVDHRAFPGHPTGQRPHLVQAHVRRVADAALAGTAGNRVLHPEAGEHLHVAVVHGYGKVHDDLAPRRAQQLPQAFFQVQFARRKIESCRLGFPGIDLLLKRYRCHTFLQFLLPAVWAMSPGNAPIHN